MEVWKGAKLLYTLKVCLVKVKKISLVKCKKCGKEQKHESQGMCKKCYDCYGLTGFKKPNGRFMTRGEYRAMKQREYDMKFRKIRKAERKAEKK